MEKPTLIYCYDAYCGWCYGFSSVMKRIAVEFIDRVQVEVLSGGMIIEDRIQPIEAIASYIESAYPRVEELTGVTFGSEYLWHIRNPQLSDWVMNSEKPSIALSILKTYFPGQQAKLASDIQFLMYGEGRDLCDDEAYRALVIRYGLDADQFIRHLHDESFLEQARYEFALCKQLQVSGFPAVLLQENESRFHLLARGYTDYDTLAERLSRALGDVKQVGGDNENRL
jgi:putative protein-disulfide isomerase